MKIKTTKISYDELSTLPKRKHKKPIKPGNLMSNLMTTLAKGELRKIHFTHETEGMEKINPEEPCLVLMNHSSFIDLSIAKVLMKDRPLQIVCTSDGFVGKEGLMRRMGCIPTQKFVTDMALVKDMHYCINTLGSSILLYPEASYSFDGTATPLPDSLPKCLKFLNVPVIFIETKGAFHRDPLYNGLRLRKVAVSAKMTYLLSPAEIQAKSTDELKSVLDEAFSFDHFAWQKEQQIPVTENFRTLGLERVLYKCPHCFTEGKTEGTGVDFICHNCGKTYHMTTYGQMEASDGQTLFSHIPDWYRWEREKVKEEIEKDQYELNIPVEIGVLKDFQSIYMIGDGNLVHNKKGFHLTGCEGKLDYSQSPRLSYSLYADYFWYEIGDVICIGDSSILYYCFPKEKDVCVAKARLATEELWKKHT